MRGIPYSGTWLLLFGQKEVARREAKRPNAALLLLRVDLQNQRAVWDEDLSVTS